MIVFASRNRFLIFVAGVLLFACPLLRAMESPMVKRMDIDIGRARLVKLNQPLKSVFIANPEVAAFQVPEPDRIIVFGISAGQTTLIAVNAAGDVIYERDITVTNDLAQAREMLAREFPHLTLRIESLPDGLMVMGDVPDPQTAGDVVALLDAFSTVAAAPQPGGGVGGGMPEAQSEGAAAGGGGGGGGGGQSGSGNSTSGTGKGKGTMGARTGKVINRLRVTTPTQVAIHIRFAEVNRRVTEQLGFKWRLWGKTFGMGNVPTADSGFFITGNVGAAEKIAGFMDALAEENLVSILAEPNLSVLSGETATFMAGGEIPFPEMNDNGNVSANLKPFGIFLRVTATVLSPSRISLRVAPEVSQPNYANGLTINGVLTPGFSIRKAETTIELASGQSFALAGLLQNDIINSVSKIPGVGDLPVIGALARSKSFERSETELVIIATAYIVNPSSRPLAVPNQKIKVSDPWRRLFLDKNPEMGATTVRSEQFIF